jgi:para-nitrobenzyl esterase
MHEHIVRVKINTGTIEGFTRDGVHRWRAIPYARPPVGRLRFRAPRPAEPWPGVRYCHGFGYSAPQLRKYTMTGLGKYQPMSEDCLTLNVVAPAAADPRHDPPSRPEGQLPVMLFVQAAVTSSAVPRRRFTTAPRWPGGVACTCRSTTGSARWGAWTCRRFPRRRIRSTATCSCATW